jgi:hypothetical protein
MIIPLLTVHVIYNRIVFFFFTTPLIGNGVHMRNRNLIPVRGSNFKLLHRDQSSSGVETSVPGCKRLKIV